ncbi:MAG: LpqC, poly [Alphaproteobacteria bacterium]|nr:LpqC, poly [Alphaproteobacteria bacterium]
MHLPHSNFAMSRSQRRHPIGGAAASGNRLSELDPIKPNPGNLRGLYYVPEGLEAGAPLVVVLHGCTQTAADYDHGAGWSRLADRHRFAVLFPEQQRENNAHFCFNWFMVGDSQRGMGEPASIAAMVAAMRTAHGIDRSRIFITGLSAGGAMASVMLATYPETFAGGAIIAGLPYGCASDVREAFDCMGGRARMPAEELARTVRRASPHKGPWPRISVWQGSADTTVAPSNADAIVRQWSQLHGVPPEPSRTDQVDGYPHQVWLNAAGEPVIERYDIIGMAHGTPLMPGSGEGQSGEARAHMLDARISSTDHIAAFFGLVPAPHAQQSLPQIAPEPASPASRPRRPAPTSAPTHAIAAPIALEMPDAPPPPGHARPSLSGPSLSGSSLSGVQKVIEDALRAAGLMK